MRALAVVAAITVVGDLALGYLWLMFGPWPEGEW